MNNTHLCLAVFVLLQSCSNNKISQPPSQPLETTDLSITNSPPPKKTSEARRKQLSEEYNQAVILNILELDDGVTSPDIIARAALSRCSDRYKQWKRATVGEDLLLDSKYKRDVFESILNKFPDQNSVDMWTSFVLQFRKSGQKITPEGRKKMEELGITR